jgi:hypothetical protein
MTTLEFALAILLAVAIGALIVSIRLTERAISLLERRDSPRTIEIERLKAEQRRKEAA